MISAADVSKRWVKRILPRGRAGSSPGSPWTSGIMATPVSKPDSPSASFGNNSSETPIMANGLPCAAKSDCFQSTK